MAPTLRCVRMRDVRMMKDERCRDERGALRARMMEDDSCGDKRGGDDESCEDVRSAVRE